MGNSMLPEYVAFAHKPRPYMMFAAVASLLPILGLCYISGMVWSRQIITNAAEVVAAQRQTLWRPGASGAVALAAAGSGSTGSIGSSSCHPVIKLIPPPKTRQDIAQLLEHEGFEVGAELGVGQGVFTAETLYIWRSCKRFYLVDPYQPASTALPDKTKQQQRQRQKEAQQQQQQQKQQDEAMQQAHENLQAWQDKLVWLRNTTTEGARHIREPLDYVYLDARRDYCSVLQDLETWWPLIKPGGVMAGHSYENAVDVLRQSGQDWSRCADGSTVNQGAVQAAVNEFFEQQGLQIVVTYRETAWNSWLVRKPHYPCGDQEAAGAAVRRQRHEPLTQLLSKMLQQEQPQQQQGDAVQQQEGHEGESAPEQLQQQEDAQLLLGSASVAEQQQQLQQLRREAAEQQQAALLKLHDSQALAASRARHEAAETAAEAGSSSSSSSDDVFGDIFSAEHHADLDH